MNRFLACVGFLVIGSLVSVSASSESQPRSLESITLKVASARIRASEGPTVVVFYSTRCPICLSMFPGMVALARSHKDFKFLAFSVDRELDALDVPQYLEEHSAPFPAVHVQRWPDGAFMREMATFGIPVGQTWVMPLVAVRDSLGETVWTSQGRPSVSTLARFLDTTQVASRP